MKIAHLSIELIVLALCLGAAEASQAQNVGIGFSSPNSKLSVNGNLAIGSGFNDAAPTNGAIIQGTVGIGTSTPTQASLVIAAGITGTVSSGEFFNYAAGPNLQGFGSATGAWSIYTVGGIASVGDVVTNSNIVSVTTFSLSDARLKNVIGLSDSRADLQTLEKLQVADYTMKDTRATGSRVFKKLIAQQVEGIYPEAVKKGTGQIPDIYSTATVTKKSDELFEITIEKTSNVQAGDRVEVYGPDGLPHCVTAECVSGRTFYGKMKGIPDGAKVFVYGRQVDDLRSIDYEAVRMLNVSATQELAKKVETLEQENSQLKNENNRLTAVEEQDHAEIASLRASNDKLAAMAAKIEVLEDTVATMQEKENVGVRTAALRQ